MKKMVFATIAAVILSAVSSCCGCGKVIKNPKTLTSNAWFLVEMNAKKELAKDDNNSFTVQFDDIEKRVTGMAECNRFFGGYKLEPVKRIEFSAMGMTRAMCPNDLLEQEFMKTLQEVDSYNIDGDMLLLQKNGEVVLIFQAVPATKN